MISHIELSEMLDCDIVKELGFSDQEFTLLPYEYQKALIMSWLKKQRDKNILIDFRKRMTLLQFNLKEIVNQKILSTIIKK